MILKDTWECTRKMRCWMTRRLGEALKDTKVSGSIFTSYFIGYKTQTRLLKLVVAEDSAHLEVEFTGKFPEGTIGGMFDFTFRDGKIATVTADLM